jgi:CRP-like cAMP-binding protein
VATGPIDALKKVPLFAELDDRELQQIASSMRERRFSAGDTVTQEGRGGAGFFVVEEGEAEVSVAGETKPWTVGPGDYFGEIALINESHRDADRQDGHGLLRHDAVGLPAARRDQLRDRVEAAHGDGREDEVVLRRR